MLENSVFLLHASLIYDKLVGSDKIKILIKKRSVIPQRKRRISHACQNGHFCR